MISGSARMVKILLDGKASVDIQSHAQLTAQQIATNKQLTPILELFRVRLNIAVEEERMKNALLESEASRNQREAQFENQLAKLDFMKMKKQRVLDFERYVTLDLLRFFILIH